MQHKYGAYSGIREVDGKEIRFASRMEFNYYLYLAWLKKMGEIKDFEYQPEAFDFRRRAKERPDLWKKEWLPSKGKYRPDFKVEEEKRGIYYIETVGMLRGDHKRNFRLLHQLFPEVKLEVVTTDHYRAIEKSVKAIIPGWERGNFKGQESRFGRR